MITKNKAGLTMTTGINHNLGMVGGLAFNNPEKSDVSKKMPIYFQTNGIPALMANPSVSQ
jgi:hypothetical protein